MKSVTRLRDFILYNNTFVLILGFVMLGGGTVLAANEDVREVVVSAVVEQESTVTSVDNTYIRTVDLDSFEPTVQVIDVRDDGEFYYVQYELTTIDLYDAVWQPITIEDELRVEMARVEGLDLGLYLAEEFGELTTDRKRYLREVQEAEIEAGAQEKVVTHEYLGLVGRFLDPEEETFAGYDPVVASIPQEDEPEPTPPADDDSEESPQADPEPENNGGGQGASGGGDPAPVGTDPVVATTTPEEAATSTELAASTTQPQATSSDPVVNEPAIDTVPPVLSLLGEASIELNIGDTYEESGATAMDDVDGDLSDVVEITGDVDVSTTGVYILEYAVTDTAGNTSSLQREVTVLEVIKETLEEEVSNNASGTPAT